MSTIIVIHTTFGVAALLAGATNLLMMKGTHRHRWMGWVYGGSMLLLILTSFFIYEAFGRFGIFHVFSIMSGGGLLVALYFPLFGRHHRHWMGHHYAWISYSYVGLVMATGSHFVDILPGGPFTLRALLFWGLPLFVGSFLIHGPGRKTLRRVAAERQMIRDAL